MSTIAIIQLIVYGLLAILVADTIRTEIQAYMRHEWRKYTLTDNEWHRLQLHEQTLRDVSSHE
jgi:hypothetical protein